MLSEHNVLSLASYSSAYATTADEGFFRSRIHPVVAELTGSNLRYSKGTTDSIACKIGSKNKPTHMLRRIVLNCKICR